jgi:NADH dehydrogenase (ubiquinone) Fe-S protein 4
MQGTKMTFNTKEDAIAFAEKQGIEVQDSLTIGWEYYIQEPHNRQFKPKAYATNFNYCNSVLTSLIQLPRN